MVPLGLNGASRREDALRGRPVTRATRGQRGRGHTLRASTRQDFELDRPYTCDAGVRHSARPRVYRGISWTAQAMPTRL